MDHIRHIRQTPEACMAAIRQDPFAFCYIKKQTPELCMFLFTTYGWDVMTLFRHNTKLRAAVKNKLTASIHQIPPELSNLIVSFLL